MPKIQSRISTYTKKEKRKKKKNKKERKKKGKGRKKREQTSHNRLVEPAFPSGRGLYPGERPSRRIFLTLQYKGLLPTVTN